MEDQLKKDFADWIFSGNEQKVKEMIEKGIELNEIYPGGMTPLIIAVEGDQPKILEILLENGANPNKKSGINGTTPLHWAVEYAIDGMIQNERETPYPEAMACIKILLENGADKNIKDKNGKVPRDYQMTEDLLKILDS